ncbi:hypothetical protein DLM77_15130 [Leptospira yasudae]|uniref:Uncharacterized protein n=1 Tax=Leptospira yasudae TaxID=2202201 RepID=A0ABX9M1S8_9LEPT|nr:hypothetical protein DLM77_15130 [Leptospira yasudae]
MQYKIKVCFNFIFEPTTLIPKSATFLFSKIVKKRYRRVFTSSALEVVESKNRIQNFEGEDS